MENQVVQGLARVGQVVHEIYERVAAIVVALRRIRFVGHHYGPFLAPPPPAHQQNHG